MGMKEEFAHLADWVDVEEKRKETLKNGLLAFLKKHEKAKKGVDKPDSA